VLLMALRQQHLPLQQHQQRPNNLELEKEYRAQGSALIHWHPSPLRDAGGAG
jgi:hypothetical protein